MKKKLELKKEVIARLDGDQMRQIVGGQDMKSSECLSDWNLCTTSCLSRCDTELCTRDTICESCMDCEWKESKISVCDSCKEETI